MKSIFNIKSIFVVLCCFAALSANAQDNVALKAYKSGFPTKHKIVFGWYDCYDHSWSGVSTSAGGVLGGAMQDLPDSVDCLSMWAWTGKMDEARKEDIRKTKAKGTRLLISHRTSTPGGDFTKSGEAYSNDQAGMEKYVKAIVDRCREYKLNGFDWGHEDMGGYLYNNASAFLLALRKAFNEYNETVTNEEDKLYVCINIMNVKQRSHEYYTHLSDEAIDAVDIFFWQTYDIPVRLSEGHTDYNFSSVTDYMNTIKGLKTSKQGVIEQKSVMTSDFEEGYRRCNFMSLAKQAKASNLMGVGVYRIQLDVKYSKAPFASVKEVIQLLNQK